MFHPLLIQFNSYNIEVLPPFQKKRIDFDQIFLNVDWMMWKIV